MDVNLNVKIKVYHRPLFRGEKKNLQRLGVRIRERFFEFDFP